MRTVMSGRNDQRDTRTVYLVDGTQLAIEIGEVIPITTVDGEHWEARDKQGRLHGDRWTRDWYAANALARAIKC